MTSETSRVRLGTGHRLGLLIGIQSYPRLDRDAQLRGGINDVLGLADVLESRFGFRGDDLDTVLDAQATRKGILNALDQLIDRVEPGDIVFIHYSGHGSQVLDAEGDEPDGLDETWVPFDGHRKSDEPCLDITDDTLFLRWSRLRQRGAFLTLSFDCCHSGHVHRSVMGARRVKADLRPRPPTAHSPAAFRGADLSSHQLEAQSVSNEPYGDSSLPRFGNQVAFAACRDDQLAFETPIGKGPTGDLDAKGGAWTWALLRVLQELNEPATAREVFAKAVETLMAEHAGQWPQIVGERDRVLFGIPTLRPKRHVLVTGGDGLTVQLNAGAAIALETGSKWGLYSANVRDPQDHEPIAQAELTSVGPLSSTAHLLDGGDPIAATQPGNRAFELFPAYGESILGVTVAPDCPHRQALLTGISSSPILRLSRAPESPEIQIQANGDLTDSKAQVLHLKEPPGSSGYVMDRVRRAERRARYLHGLKLNNKDPGTALGGVLNLRLLGAPVSDGAHRLPSIENGVSSFKEGDRLYIEISHRADRGLYVYLLDFGFTDGVSLLYPEAGGADLLDPDLPLRLGILEGDEMELFFPSAFSSHEAIGFLKVFATTRPTDFSWICTEHDWPRPSRNLSSLETLLAFGKPTTSSRGKEEDWTTCRQPLRLRR